MLHVTDSDGARHTSTVSFTSQRLSVMGFMLNSFTSPKSWYIYSKQLSICSHEGRERKFRHQSLGQLWMETADWVMERQCQQTSLCSQCQTSNVGFLSASIVSWDSVYCRNQTNKAIRTSNETVETHEVSFVCESKDPVDKPLGNWGHLV